MSEFRARFSAELDTARVEQQIRNLENRRINLDLDTNDAERRIRQLEHELQQAEQRTRTFANTLRGTVIAARAFDAIRSAARNATESIKDFDDAITDLRMATGESYDHVRGLVKEYNNLGKSLGAITTEVTDSADAWLRQGHSIADTNMLIRDSMILSKVAELDSADATEYLTSAMKGYKVAVGDVIGIVDKLTAIDLVSATDAGGLAEAMSRTAVTAKQAGVSMDQLLAYLAVTGEVTQKSMTSIGEAFKTIFTRMADIKAGKLQFIS